MSRILVLVVVVLVSACPRVAAHDSPSVSDASVTMDASGPLVPAATAPVFAPFHVPTDADEGLVGTPSAPNRPFVFRTRELPGTVIPPHTHPIDENITVVHGTFYFGIGPRFDPAALHALPVGSFVFIPRGTPMFGYSRDAVTLQIHGVGAFKQHFVDPLYTLTTAGSADPDLGSLGVDLHRFRFHAKDFVSTPRGSGAVKEGFALGALVEYILVAKDGHLFMAQEQEMHAIKPK